VGLLGLVLCACGDGGSGRTASPRPPTSSAAVAPPPASVCADLRLAAPYLEGIRRDSINGEALVDGLGDSAAQLKDDVRALRDAGRTELASALDRYERELTDLRVAAQAIELEEASGSQPVDTDAERDLERDLAVLASLRARLHGMLAGTACGDG
jgi:hypothetical protein